MLLFISVVKSQQLFLLPLNIQGGEIINRRYTLVFIGVIFSLLLIGKSFSIVESNESKNIDTQLQTKNTNEKENIYLTKQVTPSGVMMINPTINERDNTVGTNIKIAILDSGIYKEHPDLEGIVKKQYNAISPDEPVVDNFGHGTAIAGIIAAKDNDFGIIGLIQNAEVYDVKVLNEQGKGKPEHLAAAIDWCIEQEVDLINVSFGYQNEDLKVKEAIERAISSNIIIIAAAGNTYGIAVDYPAKYNGVISVTSIDEQYNRSNFAAAGKIDLSSPGVDVLTTNHKGVYSYFSGTSFANAYVTGTIASILSNHSEEHYDSKEIFNYIKHQTMDLGEIGYDEKYGYGFLTVK